MEKRKATCACERLQLSVNGSPELMAICSCNQCQRRTGSVYSAHAFFAESDVTIQGDSSTFTRSSDSGNRVTFHFCPTCASTVFWKAHKRPHSWGIAAGAMSGTPLPAPVAAVFVENKADWVPLPKDMTLYDQGAS